MDKKRIDLEEKIAHLENNFEQLNNVIFRQRQTLDEYQLLLKHLSKKIQALEENQSNGASEVANEKPPHY